MIDMIGGGLSNLYDYMINGINYVLQLLSYVPVEISAFMVTAMLMSLVFLYLGRTSNN